MSPAEIGNAVERVAAACSSINEGGGVPSEFVNARVKYFLNRAVRDCHVLDGGPWGFFAERLMKSLARTDAPLRVFRYSTLSEDMGKWGKVEEAYDRSIEDGERAMMLYRLRELASDRLPLSDILAILAPDIEAKAKGGDVRFFEAFGEELGKIRKNPESFHRKDVQWMVRGWLSLALWTCESVGEVEDLAERTFPLIGVEWSRPRSAEEATKFAKAWWDAGHGKRRSIE